ncbi:SDR family oxidoreductase [Ilumatobacter nonamiensis]|uniref:SDR family oxidoreductase n=1 Tax=Ilumatobacter nonamiensis TaxID=467093 RepID=UPI000345E2CC|nr:SDR family oxidoreductase [Ilumatobacter nonamiensis]
MTSPASSPGDSVARSPGSAIFVPDLLAGSTALVTGGGTGLGRAIAEGLSAAGADVVIAARRQEVLDEAAAEITSATGNQVVTDLVDIRDRASVEALAGRHDVDILVNNAGGQFPQEARRFSPNGWNSVVDLNLNATWSMTQVFGNQMLDGGGGVIIQIVAIVGRGIPGIAHSAAARAGVIELAKTLAFEWGPKVRVNCVAPGAFRTDGWEKTYDEEVGNDMSAVPLPYPGRPSDIANSVVFLASPAAAYVTGECLYVDGGHALHGPISALPPGAYSTRP